MQSTGPKFTQTLKSIPTIQFAKTAQDFYEMGLRYLADQKNVQLAVSCLKRAAELGNEYALEELKSHCRDFCTMELTSQSNDETWNAFKIVLFAAYAPLERREFVQSYPHVETALPLSLRLEIDWTYLNANAGRAPVGDDQPNLIKRIGERKKVLDQHPVEKLTITHSDILNAMQHMPPAVAKFTPYPPASQLNDIKPVVVAIDETKLVSLVISSLTPAEKNYLAETGVGIVTWELSLLPEVWGAILQASACLGAADTLSLCNTNLFKHRTLLWSHFLKDEIAIPAGLSSRAFVLNNPLSVRNQFKASVLTKIFDKHFREAEKGIDDWALDCLAKLGSDYEQMEEEKSDAIKFGAAWDSFCQSMCGRDYGQLANQDVLERFLYSIGRDHSDFLLLANAFNEAMRNSWLQNKVKCKSIEFGVILQLNTHGLTIIVTEEAQQVLDKDPSLLAQIECFSASFWGHLYDCADNEALFNFSKKIGFERLFNLTNEGYWVLNDDGVVDFLERYPEYVDFYITVDICKDIHHALCHPVIQAALVANKLDFEELKKRPEVLALLCNEKFLEELKRQPQLLELALALDPKQPNQLLIPYLQ